MSPRKVLCQGDVDLDLKVDELILTKNTKRQSRICRVAPDKIKIIVPPIVVEYNVRKRLCRN
jgi:hypothetical protein